MLNDYNMQVDSYGRNSVNIHQNICNNYTNTDDLFIIWNLQHV